jgi:hypothetical protein
MHLRLGVQRSRTGKRSGRMLRPLRGRVRIQPDDPPRKIGLIHVPYTVVHQDPMNRKLARTGIVLAMGDPALDKRGREVPFGFEIGDRVIYIFGQLSSDGVDAWCAQSEVLGVIEPDEFYTQHYAGYDRADLENLDVN